MAAETPFANDVCNGAAEIGDFIGEDERRALRLCYTGQIPGWKEGGRWRMRKSRYRQQVTEREDANLARAAPMAPVSPGMNVADR